MQKENSRFRQLSDGTQIPAVGLGVYQVGEQAAQELVYEALEVGYRLFDSAQAYRNEAGVARGIAAWLEGGAGRRREDVYFTTKIDTRNHGYEATKASLERSLRAAAKLGYIDLVLVHAPMSDRNRRLGTWQALQEAVATGQVRSIGVSNYGQQHLSELLSWEGLKIRPVLNQIELNPWLCRQELVRYCRENDIAVEAYSPLMRGKRLDDPVLQKVAHEYDKGVAQILVRWSLQMGFIVLPKTSKIERLAPNYDIWNFELSAETMSELTHPDDYFVTVPQWDPTTYDG
ncbi:AaceriABL209Cp [[Ashbya] aceris (nom. inval.)]|nr:AaceriABL209Cp [[Ashbya] aceris (nom. inval.)]